VERLGLRVPDDLAMVGFDDHPFYEHLSPPLTAVAQPIRELGLAATEMLLALLAGGEPEPSRILPTRIVRRASCGGRADASRAAVASRGIPTAR